MNLRPSQNIRNIVDQIKQTGETRKIVKRDLLKEFGKSIARKPIGEAIVRFFVNEEIEIIPRDIVHFPSWGEVSLKAKKPKVQRNKNPKPTARTLANLLNEKKDSLAFVERNDAISKALSKMSMNDYSQLPIVEPESKVMCGYISWRTIGETMLNDKTHISVLDYGSTNFEHVFVSESLDLITAARMLGKYEFLFIKDRAGQIKDIVTMSDITDLYVYQTEPFLLLEEIEDCIRNLLSGKFSEEEIVKVCGKAKGSCPPLEQLDFSQYIKLIEYESEMESYFNRLQLKNIDKSVLVSKLREIKDIRNSVMHFKPDPMTESRISVLHSAVKFFRLISTK